MESVRYLLLILMIVNDIHSHQDAMGDMIQSWKNKQEYDINEIKDAIRSISKSIQEMKHNSQKQRDDFSIMKDTIGNMSKSIIEMKNNSQKIKDTVKAVSDLQGKMEVDHKNFTRTLNFICKEPGSLCTPKFYDLSTDTASFTEASTKCQSKNMTFVSLKSDEEFDALSGHFKSTTVTGQFRLSARRENAESEFFWIPSGQLLTNEEWWPGHPVKSDQYNCLFVQLFSDKKHIKFHVDECSIGHKYVCEYKK